MNKQDDSRDSAVNLFMAVPMFLIMLILLAMLPLILLYFCMGIVIKELIYRFRKNRFFRRNAGKRILCVTHGQRYRVFQARYGNQLLLLGIDEIVVFDVSKNDNRYDGFVWNNMIASRDGFPLLVTLQGKTMVQQTLRHEVFAFLNKEIDWLQLEECIKRRVDGNSE
ncbi:hypothetical protein [Dawidia soli]|uniref:Uncharacterized protein n=1 Tax=Dawidia soli TaxID=2782352 RepID=A0AAP2DCU3_9BACT|nr:hypothetical protein [Dawidia soli]MBT1689304.1 hypothetical protein [Dawidia soli]